MNDINERLEWFREQEQEFREARNEEYYLRDN